MCNFPWLSLCTVISSKLTNVALTSEVNFMVSWNEFMATRKEFKSGRV